MVLNYKTFGTGFPVIILHGLLGSLDNWQSIAKKLAEHYQVYIVDQRNHGKSPHSSDFSYPILSADLLQFMDEHGIQQAHLIGHSMGGKTVMQFAMQHPERISKLIIVDSSPTAFEDRHSAVFKALFAADVQHATDRREVEKTLRDKLDGDETTVQFLMKGLNRDDAGANFEWKFNARALWDNYANIAGAIEYGEPFTGPTLFVKGENSDYINPDNYVDMNELFPNNHVIEIKGAGHWVHADNPTDFTAEVLNFLA
jgi:pimeloyl-ACP methyl ester carboxylesterase